MKHRLAVLLVSAGVVSGVLTFVHASPAAGCFEGEAANDAASRPPAPTTTLRVLGTIDKFDPATRILSLSTSTGAVQLPLAATARIRQGWRTVDASALERLSGYRAAVRYSESDGHKTVESVHIFGKSERTEQ